MNKKTLLKIIFFITLVTVVVWVGIRYRHLFDIAQIQNFLANYGVWAPVVFICLYVIATVLFLPGSALTIAGGLIFGAFWGTIYNLLGAVTGATIAFLIARYLASDWVARKAGGKLKILLDGVTHEGWRFVAIVRLVPLFPFNLLNYALGLTRIGVFPFIVASAIFMLPGTFAYTYIGSLGQTFIQGNAREIVTKVSIAIGLLILLACIPWIIKRWRGSKINSK